MNRNLTWDCEGNSKEEWGVPGRQQCNRPAQSRMTEVSGADVSGENKKNVNERFFITLPRKVKTYVKGDIYHVL